MNGGLKGYRIGWLAGRLWGFSLAASQVNGWIGHPKSISIFPATPTSGLSAPPIANPLEQTRDAQDASHRLLLFCPVQHLSSLPWLPGTTKVPLGPHARTLTSRFQKRVSAVHRVYSRRHWDGHLDSTPVPASSAFMQLSYSYRRTSFYGPHGCCIVSSPAGRSSCSLRVACEADRDMPPESRLRFPLFGL